jgi:hypothetical protein
MGKTGSRECFMGAATRREEKRAAVRHTIVVEKGRMGINRGYVLLMGTD